MTEVELTPELQPRNRRLLVAVGLTTLAAMTVLIIVNFVLLLSALKPDSTHLGPFTDPVILNRVPGVEGPAARRGEIISYRGERCAEKATTIETVTFFQPHEGRSIPADRVKSDLGMRGCFSIPQQVPMGNDVGPGEWALSGIVRDVKSGEVRYWTSQTFQVVP